MNRILLMAVALSIAIPTKPAKADWNGLTDEQILECANAIYEFEVEKLVR